MIQLKQVKRLIVNFLKEVCSVAPVHFGYQFHVFQASLAHEIKKTLLPKAEGFVLVAPPGLIHPPVAGLRS